ncbi:MAG TPA: hypothetical protein VHE35_21875 [Kofleriaceae bacterium]|nr:hypothetical protein [Kofleriaceae bacterium]
MIVSESAYLWFVSLATGLAAVYWIGIDTWRLRKALAADRKDPAVRDRIFGSSLGLVVGVVGVVGVLHFLVKHKMI